ncbi:hypothetical protein Tco_0328466 [Tanacetum coccineum]
MPTEAELALEQSQQGLSYEVSRSTRFYQLSHSEIVDIEKVAVRSSLRLPNNKCALIDSQAGIKSPMHYPCDNCQNIRVILFSIHSDDRNPSRVNIKHLCDARLTRTASAAAKPCQGDSFEFHLITSSIYTD